MPRKHYGTPDGYNTPFPKAFRALLAGNVGKIGKVSQQAVADYIGKSRQMVGYYADGSVVPDAEIIVKIADFFDVSADYLLGRAEYTDAELQRATLADYGFTQTAALSIDRMHINKALTSHALRSEDANYEQSEIYTGEALDMLICLLEDPRFIGFLHGAADYANLSLPNGSTAEGKLTTHDAEYSFKMPAAVVKGIFLQKALEPLTEAIDAIAAERAKIAKEDTAK